MSPYAAAAASVAARASDSSRRAASRLRRPPPPRPPPAARTAAPSAMRRRVGCTSASNFRRAAASTTPGRGASAVSAAQAATCAPSTPPVATRARAESARARARHRLARGEQRVARARVRVLVRGAVQSDEQARAVEAPRDVGRDEYPLRGIRRGARFRVRRRRRRSVFFPFFDVARARARARLVRFGIERARLGLPVGRRTEPLASFSTVLLHGAREVRVPRPFRRRRLLLRRLLLRRLLPRRRLGNGDALRRHVVVALAEALLPVVGDGPPARGDVRVPAVRVALAHARCHRRRRERRLGGDQHGRQRRGAPAAAKRTSGDASPSKRTAFRLAATSESRSVRRAASHAALARSFRNIFVSVPVSVF